MRTTNFIRWFGRAVRSANIDRSALGFLLAVVQLFAGSIGSALATQPMVAAGGLYSLALKSDGTVVSWGTNFSGQLGAGQAAMRATPGKVAGLGKVTDAVAGLSFSVAVGNDGSLWAWGINSNNQLGDGTNQDRSHPVKVVGLAGKAIAISAGQAHCLAIGDDGSVSAWGYGGYGQLGNTTDDLAVATKVTGLPKVIAVAGGRFHSLALGSDGSVWTWGANNYGQLGDGTRSSRPTPKQVSGLPRIQSISASSDHNLAVDFSGNVWAWGKGGVVGDGGASDRTVPFRVLGLPTITASVAASQISFALATDGSTWAWGNNMSGQFGDSQYGQERSPVRIATVAGYSNFSVGDRNVIARNHSGAIVTWGWNDFGQLGLGDTIDRAVPTPVVGLPALTHYSTSGTHVIAVADDGSVWTWGANGNGQLGDGSVAVSNLPVSVTGLNNIASVSAGSTHSMALGADGLVWTWGDNSQGQLGNKTQRGTNVPKSVLGLPPITSIAAGYDYSLAIDTTGSVWSWGSNLKGQLGIGSTNNISLNPMAVQGVSGVVSISANVDHSLVLKSDGTVWSWGANGSGQLGDGTTLLRNSPTKVVGLSKIVAISAGLDSNLALDQSGNVWTWGGNSYGQLGVGDTKDRLIPVMVTTLHDIASIAAGSGTGYAITRNGQIWVWGVNLGGSIGVPSANSYEPSPLSMPKMSSFQAVSVGAYSAMAIRTDGTLWGWGRNFEGQLGDGTFGERDAPVLVLDNSGTAVLDLDPSSTKLYSASDLPPILVRTTRYGDLSFLTVTASIKTIAAGLLAKKSSNSQQRSESSSCSPCDVFVAAVLDGNLLMEDEQRNWSIPLPQDVATGKLATFLRGVQVLDLASLGLRILLDVDVSKLPGANIFVGYGSNALEMLSAGRYYSVFTVPRS